MMRELNVYDLLGKLTKKQNAGLPTQKILIHVRVLQSWYYRHLD